MAGGWFIGFIQPPASYPKQITTMIHYFLNPTLLLIIGVLGVVADMFFQL
jgi:hypothetical protein